MLAKMGIGAGIGGLVGGTRSYINQRRSGRKVNWRKVGKEALRGAIVGGIGTGVISTLGPAFTAKFGTTVIGGTKLTFGAKLFVGGTTQLVGGLAMRYTDANMHNLLYPRRPKINVFSYTFNPNGMLGDALFGAIGGLALPSIYRKTYPRYGKTHLRYRKRITLQQRVKNLQKKIGCNPKTAHVKSGTTEELKDVILDNSDDIAKDGLKPGTLSNVDARKWYLENESKIPSMIDNSLPLKQQAKQAFNLRNQFRTQARELMSDKELAKSLYKTDPNLTWEQVVQKQMNKGLSGDDIYKAILESSQRSRTSVNESLGLK